jgi:hypothetical protein
LRIDVRRGWFARSTIRIRLDDLLKLDLWPLQQLAQGHKLAGMHLYVDGEGTQAAIARVQPAMRSADSRPSAYDLFVCSAKMLSATESQVLQWSMNVRRERLPTVSLRKDGSGELYIVLKHMEDRAPMFLFHPYICVGTIVQGTELLHASNKGRKKARRILSSTIEHVDANSHAPHSEKREVTRTRTQTTQLPVSNTKPQTV